MRAPISLAVSSALTRMSDHVRSVRAASSRKRARARNARQVHQSPAPSLIYLSIRGKRHLRARQGNARATWRRVRLPNLLTLPVSAQPFRGRHRSRPGVRRAPATTRALYLCTVQDESRLYGSCSFNDSQAMDLLTLIHALHVITSTGLGITKGH